MDQIAPAEQWHSGEAVFRIRVDVADADNRATLERMLDFAELAHAPAEPDTLTALTPYDVVVGDGQHASLTRQYVHIEDFGAPSADVVPAPLRLNPLLEAIGFALARAGAEEGIAELCPAAAAFIGVSATARKVRTQIARAGQRDVTVLVTGESGTGKEVVARALHLASPRAEGPFVPVNCGAIPADLLESELFGHEKGAFTGAITQKIGRFELAHGGTLFLDEVGDLPFPMQVKLLRALEEKRFERVGGVKSLASDVRILAATNSDLEDRISAGEFREDLYYRLNVFPIELTPLRDRTEDLPVLINHIVAAIQREQGLQLRFSMEALELLAAYPWPGNVRELVNLLHRLTIQFPNGLVRSVDLPQKYTAAAPPAMEAPVGEAPLGELQLPLNGIDLKAYLTQLEKSLIQQALQDTNSVVARAADRLHIRRTTLVEKMRKHGLGRTLDAAR